MFLIFDNFSQGLGMFLDQKVKNILLNRLHLSSSAINAIDRDFDLSAKMIGILEIVKRSPPTPQIKNSIIKQLQSVEMAARYSKDSKSDNRVNQAYLEHYSFN